MQALPVMNLLEPVCALIVAGLYWDTVASPVVVVGWTLAVIGVVILRVVGALLFRHLAPETAHFGLWRRALVAAITINGALYGYAGITFNPGAALFDPALVETQTISAALMAGLAIVAVTSYGVYLPAAVLYILAAIAPPLAHLALLDAAQSPMLIIIATILVVFLMLASRRVHSSTVSTLRLQFKNQSLIDYLDRARDDAEALNQKLSQEVFERM